ncbi:MAG: carbohydrate porin [Sulfuricella sp.]|nr:carbohydrate porin [Sulfuricella sp.]
MKRLLVKPLAAAVLLALSGGAAQATDGDVAKELRRLAERLEALEKDNAALRSQLAGESAVDKRLKVLEENHARVEQGLARENLSETEPELTSRLKAVEYQSLEMQKQSRVIEALEGITAGASFTTVAQRASGGPNNEVQLNYRTDITASTPAGTIGDVTSKIFGHFRIGQGKGLGNLMTAFSGANTSAFQLGTAEQADNSAVMLAQAWYQADIPLPLGGFKPRSKETLTVNFGKMDPFAFFDQNAGANDETRQFLSSMFVHNALLDNPLAANVGADAYGFSPGVRMSYLNEWSKPENFRLSLGVFGAGPGANFSRSFTSPFVIAQAETKQMFFGGLAGNYRVMVWRNGQAPTYVSGETRPHRGIGLNFDQRVGDGVTLFGRYGRAWGERLAFDQTLSLGAEFNGSYWNRGGDSLGVALGLNKVSADFRNDAPTLDGFGYAAQGVENVVEVYYRYRLNKQFEITPDFQWLRRPAGNGEASSVKILGARAQLVF